MIFFGLPRIADDEVGPECGLRLAGPNVFDSTQEPIPIAPPTHAPKQRLRHMLQRQVEVRDVRLCTYDVDERIREVARVEIEQAGAGHASGDLFHQRNDGASAQFAGTILSVRRQILGHEDDLLHVEGVDFFKD